MTVLFPQPPHGVLSHQTLRPLSRHASLKRSFSLLSSFRFEQSDPARFYGALAEDSAAMLEDLWIGATHNTLQDITVLDVGGGPGYFAQAFAERQAHYISCEPSVGEMAAAGIALDSSVRGSGMDLPFASDSVDICYSSNVAEHVSDPWRMGEEMLRVTRPGGMVVLSYTVWYGPFGGHEMGLTHYLGGERAARMYEKRHGHQPKNLYGTSLFHVSCAEGLQWANTTQAEGRATFAAAFPRYHPSWAWWLERIPGIREFAVSNLVLVLIAR